MHRTIAVVALLCFSLVSAHPLGAQTSPGTLRLSWAGCDQIRTHSDLSAGSVAQLVISQIGTDIPNLGHDLRLELGPDLPDAWRFDDNGCQGSSQYAARSNGYSKTCPAMQGGNPLGQFYFSYGIAERRAELNLLVTYNDVIPSPLTRYTWWVVDFDHSYSVPGTDDDPATCDGGDQTICIAISTWRPEYRPTLLGADYEYYYPIPENTFVTWGSSALPCENVVATERSSWGRVKAQYH